MAVAARRTGYVYEELFMWHNSGTISFSKWVEPSEHWENPDTKRRFNGLLAASGLLDSLVSVRARHASREEICRFHTQRYHDYIVSESSGTGGDGGELARFGPGGYEIAALSAGGVLAAVEAIVGGSVDNAYCLVRPPGHHAKADMGMGFCIFNNIAIAAKHARALGKGLQRIAIVDYDVHHGNGTQDAFWDDSETLFISIHQDNNYPVGTGAITELGAEGALGSTINLPLPPGCGDGAYDYAFDRVVIPAIHRFKPDIIFVSSGFDASFADPLGRQMLSSKSYASFTKKLLAAADDLCGGRIVFAHEGGYSKDYVPFCGVAVVEQLCGVRSSVEDSYLDECLAKGYHACQPHQAAVVDAVAALVGLAGEGRGGDAAVLQAMQTLLQGVADSGRRRAIVEALKC